MSDDDKTRLSYVKRFRKALKRTVQRGVNLTVDDRIAVVLKEVFDFEEDIEPDILRYFRPLLDASSKNAHDIMVPRSRVVMLSMEMSREQVQDVVIESRHSRYPIQGEDPDTVVGMLYSKDLLPESRDRNSDAFDLHNLSREPKFVVQDQSIVSVLNEFQRDRIHLGIVADEFQKVIGIVTMEDIFEQFFGEIVDEHDLELRSSLSIDESTGKPDESQHNGVMIIRADVSIEEFNEHFKTSLSNDQSNTIGGFFANKLGHVPVRGEKTKAESVLLEVVEADDRRIEKISVVRSGQ